MMVRATVNNVGWARVNNGAMLVASAHMIAARNDLDAKRIRDPSIVTRKRGSKPTQLSRDLFKAIEAIGSSLPPQHRYAKHKRGWQPLQCKD